MQSKLQEITDKIYQEGVAKGNAEADEIVTKAKTEADSIITEAKKQAEELLNQAKKQAEELKANTANEIQLSAQQSVNGLKQQITDLVNGSIVSNSVNAAFDSKEFTQKLIEGTLNGWASSGGQSIDINVLLSEGEVKEAGDYFAKTAKELLDKGVEIKGSGDLNKGFQIEAKDGAYKLSFTDEDFTNYFKEFLRPKLIELLYS